MAKKLNPIVLSQLVGFFNSLKIGISQCNTFIACTQKPHTHMVGVWGFAYFIAVQVLSVSA